MKLRRFGAAIMGVIMAASLSMSAFAATGDPINFPDGDLTKEVTGSYNAGQSTGGTIYYSPEVSWGNLSFTYNAGGTSQGTWNPETHQYSGGSSTQAGWTCNGSKNITVKNHSNAAIGCQLVFDAAKSGITGAFSESSFVLPTAEGTSVDNAPSKTVTFDITGGSLASGETNVKLGTITVKFTKQQ